MTFSRIYERLIPSPTRHQVFAAASNAAHGMTIIRLGTAELFFCDRWSVNAAKGQHCYSIMLVIGSPRLAKIIAE
jgi:hypothetical protein